MVVNLYELEYLLQHEELSAKVNLNLRYLSY